MLSYWQQIRRFVTDRLWVLPALAGVMSLLVAVVGAIATRFYTGPVPIDVSERALQNLLGIFTSAMLAVATFSVTAMVTSVATVMQSTTPRAARLTLADRTSQIALSSFIGAFIYAVIGILALEAFSYGAPGRFLLFCGLFALLCWVIFSFLRWVDQITKLGQVGVTTGKIVAAAMEAIDADTVGSFGARPYRGAPADALPVCAPRVGFVTEIDIERLAEIAAECDCRIALTIRPGEVVDTAMPVAHVSPPSEQARKTAVAIQDCLTIDDARTHEKDPRFGLITLAETADRALSPGVNDPGTAIAILTAELRVLTHWAETLRRPESAEIRYPNLSIPPLTARELMDDAFTPIVRDGAGHIEVGLRLQKTLQALVRLALPELTREALRISGLALEQAEVKLISETDRQRVRREAAVVTTAAAHANQAPTGGKA